MLTVFSLSPKAPFLDDSLDVLSFLSSLAITFTLLAGLIKRLDNTEDGFVTGFNDVLGRVLIVFNCIPLAYAMYDLCTVVLEQQRKKKERENGGGGGGGGGKVKNTKVLPAAGIPLVQDDSGIQSWG